MVVDRARFSDNPLHNEFEWNDAIAAEEHRRAVARVMAGCLIMTVKRVDTPPVRINAEVVKRQSSPTRALVHISNSERSGYRWTSEVLGNQSERANLLSQARRDAQAFIIKYRVLEEVGAIIAAIESTPSILQ
jgi:hypothetical protein